MAAISFQLFSTSRLFIYYILHITGGNWNSERDENFKFFVWYFVRNNSLYSAIESQEPNENFISQIAVVNIFVRHSIYPTIVFSFLC